MSARRRWSVEYVIKELEKRLVDPPGRSDVTSFDARVQESVLAWAAGENLRWPIPPLHLEGLRLMRQATHDALAGKTWDLLAFSKAVEWRALHVQLQMVHFEGVLEVGGFNAALHAKPLQFKECMVITAMMIAAGWVRPARRMIERVLTHLPSGHFPDADAQVQTTQSYRRPFAWFTLRLLADWFGCSIPQISVPHPYPAPAYNELLSCWRVPDPEALEGPMLGACEWHANECMYPRSDSPSKEVDFVDDSLMAWPLEVHMIWRLREAQGLPMPGAPAHPLMGTPLATCRPPWPKAQDEISRLVRERAKAAFPRLEGLQ